MEWGNQGVPAMGHLQLYEPEEWKCKVCSSDKLIYTNNYELVCTSCATVNAPAGATSFSTPWQGRIFEKQKYKSIYQLNQILYRYLCVQEPPDEDDVLLLHIELGLQGFDQEKPATKKAIYDTCITCNLRKLQKQWIMIRFMIYGIRPPEISTEAIREIQRLFLCLQGPFHKLKREQCLQKDRKIMIRMSYIIRRLLMQMGHWNDGMEIYFPDLKDSRRKKYYEDIMKDIFKFMGIDSMQDVEEPIQNRNA